MGRQIHKEKDWKIYKEGRGFVVHNFKIRWSEDYGHTHIRNEKTAKALIYWCRRKIIPKHISEYLLISLTRISRDQKYIDRINELMEVRKNKGKKLKYHNPGKVV